MAFHSASPPPSFRSLYSPFISRTGELHLTFHTHEYNSHTHTYYVFIIIVVFFYSFRPFLVLFFFMVKHENMSPNFVYSANNGRSATLFGCKIAAKTQSNETEQPVQASTMTQTPATITICDGCAVNRYQFYRHKMNWNVKRGTFRKLGTVV